MILFFKKITIFLIPLGLIFIFPATVLFLGREYYSIEDVIRVQAEKPETIFGFSYHDFGTLYKESLIAKADPEIIGLGSSRVMQLRKEYFSKPPTFINAGGGALGINGAEEFIQKLPADSKVNFIILGLDQEMFKVSQPSYSPAIPKIGKNAIERLMNLLVTNWKKIYLDYFSGKFVFHKLWEQSTRTSNIGVNALVNQDGYRADGSYQYRKIENDLYREIHLKVGIDSVIQSIKKDRGSFYYGNTISQEALAALGTILKTATARGIYVVGFMPPYPHQIYQEMMNTDDVYQKIIATLPQEIHRVFASYDFNFYDFSNVKVLNASDSEFVDPIHGTDKMYLRIIISMAEQNEQLQQRLDLVELKKLLKSTDKDFISVE